MGKALLDEVKEATGLPADLVDRELGELLKKSGLRVEDLTLEDLRAVLADYMQDVLCAAKEQLDKAQA